VATRGVEIKNDYTHDDEQDMTFRGFLSFLDPPKVDAQRTLHDLLRLGIRIKVISGDNRHVTAHLARAVGLNAKSVLTGEDVEGLQDEALWHLAPRTDLFVEIDPQQKERIVRALQRTGHAVGYLGDGINDAPALYAADIGISVDQAVDVARQTADVVLLRSDLGVLRQGIESGRRAMANTLKYISITTSANLGNMLSMALITPVLPFLPLLPEQILLNNLLSDLPLMAVATDTVSKAETRRAVRWDIGRIRLFTIVFGLISSVFDALTFAALLFLFHAGAVEFQTAWFVVSLLTEIAIVFVLRTPRPAIFSRPHSLLVIAAAATAALALALPYVGPVAALLGFVPLSPVVIGVMLLIVAGYAGVSELAKLWFYRRLAVVAASRT
jgi:Mg2+-importing ATPase